jgi:pSer/pThr/pTyr-binding forkhead associated (FHA) protein
LVDNNLKQGRFSISSRMKETGGSAGVGSLVLPSGERVELGKEPVSIGRLNECTIPLTDGNVSRRHAEVRASTRGYVVADLGSTNGTKVNGLRIQGEQALANGDIVSVGSTHLRFEAS